MSRFLVVVVVAVHLLERSDPYLWSFTYPRQNRCPPDDLLQIRMSAVPRRLER